MNREQDGQGGVIFHPGRGANKKNEYLLVGGALKFDISVYLQIKKSDI